MRKSKKLTAEKNSGKKLEVTRVFSFSAAHHLTQYKGVCERLHGHTYRVAVTVEGPVQKNGLVVDFTLLKKVVEEKVLKKLDHRDLNEIMPNPSAENIALWIWDKLKNINRLLRAPVELDSVRVWEGDNTYVEYEGE